MSAGSPRPGPAPRSPDDDLGDRLGQALRADLGAPVDVPALLDGSRSRARTVRNRRIGLGTAGVVLVIALPVGIEALQGPDSPGPSAVLESGAPQAPANGSSTVPAPLPSPRTGLGPVASTAASPSDLPGSAVTASVPATGASTGHPAAVRVAYSMPDSLAFTSLDLPDGLTEQADSGQSTGLPLVNGLTCAAPGPGDWRPVAGRSWTWADTSPGGTGRATLTVTGFTGGDAAAAFAELVHPSGRCRFAATQQVDSGQLSPGAEGWMASSQLGPDSYGRAVVRLGDLIAGVEVRGGTGTKNALGQAQKLAVIAVNHLSTSGLPPA